MRDKILEIILNKIKKDYADDIALLVKYNIKDEEKEQTPSLNLFFIPNTERGKSLSFQYIIDDIGYDLFPIQWERLIRVAAMDSPQAYLFKEAEIVYVGDEEAENRFYQLKQGLEDVLSGEYHQALLNKGHEYLNDSYIYVNNMANRCRTLIDFRIESSKLLNQLAHVIAFVNKGYYLGGHGSTVSVIESSKQMGQLPNDYCQLVDSIVFGQDSDTILENSNTLLNNTRNLLQSLREAHIQKEPFQLFFKGYFEELKKYTVQFKYAIENDRYLKQFELASYLHEEVSQFLMKSQEGIWYDDRNVYDEYCKCFNDYFNVDFMDLIANQKKEELLIQLIRFESTFVELLEKHHIELATFKDINSFEHHFMKL